MLQGKSIASTDEADITCLDSVEAAIPCGGVARHLPQQEEGPRREMVFVRAHREPSDEIGLVTRCPMDRDGFDVARRRSWQEERRLRPFEVAAMRRIHDDG